MHHKLSSALFILALAAGAYCQIDTVCLVKALPEAGLVPCKSVYTASNLTGFCESSCGPNITNAFAGCGFEETCNPVIHACGPLTGNTPNSANEGPDFVCYFNELHLSDFDVVPCMQLLQESVTDFCSSNCAPDIQDIYTNCGASDACNPIIEVCASADGGAQTISAIAMMMMSTFGIYLAMI